MLDGSDSRELMADLWAVVTLKTRLPDGYSDFFESHGPMPCHFDSRRAFHRFYLREQAFIKRQGDLVGVFTTDVSRCGMGILSPIQLLPKEHVDLQLASGRQYRLEVARCRRIDVGCYECGTRFVL